MTVILDQYLRQTKHTLHWIAQQNYIAVIHNQENCDLFRINFIKSRNNDAMLKWCEQSWGPPQVNGNWWQMCDVSPYQLQLVVRGEELITMWKLSWE